MIRQKLETAIKNALGNLGIAAETVVLEHPADISHGDYSTSVALAQAKAAGMNPRELAEKIVAELEKHPIAEVAKIEIAGPGFINFHFSNEHFATTVADISAHAQMWGANGMHAGKKILVEHSSPNLFKPFHIGHVMNNAIGESITRLARHSGAEVTEVSYPSDISLGIGKAVWVILKKGGAEKIQSFATDLEALEYLGDCYVRGTKAFEEDPEAAKEIRAITSQLYEHDAASDAWKAYEAGKDINLAYFKKVTKRLGSKFDAFIYESEAGVEGAKIVRANTPAVFKESEGAHIYEGEQDGLHTRVFINKEGYPTYEAKDVGLMSIKFSRYSPDISIFITDHEQQEYFRVVAAAAGKVNPVWKERTIHRTHGRMSFKGQKMSSRLGGVPLAQTLVDTLHEEVAERSDRLDAVADAASIDAIGIAALKFVILRAMAGKNINFDPDTSLSFDGDSGPYLQYTFVRAKSVLEKAKAEGLTANAAIPDGWTATDIEKVLVKFPDVVAHATEEWAPHHVAGYLLDLAQAFNSWYGNTKIADAADLTSPYKLALTQAFQTTMQNGLYLLGIQVPDKM
jgi:arginyl-tRNA synthetase